MNQELKYQFHWDLIGDLEAGRPNLGVTTRLETYRLMQFTLRDVLERKFGAEAVDRVFYEAGSLAGQHFYQNILGPVSDFDTFLNKLQQALIQMNIGILRLEKSDLAQGTLVLTISEDLDCSGLPELDYEVCKYDEGFIAGLLSSFTGKHFVVREIDCWCTGDRTCRFTAEMDE